MNVSRSAVVPAVLLSCLFAAACGGSTSPGGGRKPASTPTLASASPLGPVTETEAEVVPAVEAVVTSANSMHISGTASARVSIDMSFYGPTDLWGTISMAGKPYTVLVVGGKTYAKLTKFVVVTMEKLPISACAQLCGKYALITGSQLAGFDLASVVDSAFHSLPAAAHDTKALVSASYDGRPVFQFTQSGFVFDVAASGVPYPVRVTGNGTDLTFSDWNSIPPPKAPPASQIVTRSQVQHYLS